MTDPLDAAELERRAEEELDAAAKADSPADRKRHLDQAASFAHESEQSRR